MPLFEIHKHVHHHILLQADDPIVRSIIARLDGISNRQDKLMIDTTKLLAAVAAERTESASLRSLLAANTQAQKDTSAQLAALQAQIAAGTPITAEQIAAIQADVDSATTDLSADNAAAADAITANTLPTAAPAATPPNPATPAPVPATPAPVGGISPDGPPQT